VRSQRKLKRKFSLSRQRDGWLIVLVSDLVTARVLPERTVRKELYSMCMYDLVVWFVLFLINCFLVKNVKHFFISFILPCCVLCTQTPKENYHGDGIGWTLLR